MNKDIFPLLDLQELVICLQSCDFSMATEESISRPTPQYVITLYKQIIDSFMGVSPDTLLKENEGVEDEGNSDDYNAIYADTLRVLTLNKICFKFFEDIGVSDFNIMDLYKPEPARTRRLLSAVVNYARFREERMFDCDQFLSQTESLLGRLRQKFDDYNFLQQQIKRYEDLNDLKEGEDLASLEERNKNLEQQLKKLTQIQETLTIDYNSYKSSKQKLMHELETSGFELIELESQRDKLQRYSETNMSNLDTTLKELAALYEKQQERLSQLEVRQKKLILSMETFQTLTSELYDVLKIVSTELQESHVKETGLVELKEQLLQSEAKLKNLLSSGVLVKVSIVQSQLTNQKEKLEELERTTKEKQKENRAALEKLQSQYSDTIVPEVQRTEEHIATELIGGVVSELEKEMQSLKDEFQRESDAIELEYSLLAGHINKYMGAMLEKMK
ncbi:LAFE_0E03246g1_1 [Lachancea fermentati]|uniref:LAFE_0E03246g1_1 n=1 Tax=Lachancea fermentati TaxID=4955 RepID=A0A1G4MCH4_LACFM|nr:LAFE_0E03246g1_1 [Lachancea fermentati]